jgi:hypothetical protein
MTRYLVFLGDDYYPKGGWRDFQGAFDTLREAQALVQQRLRERGWMWAHIVDTETMQIVQET